MEKRVQYQFSPGLNSAESNIKYKLIYYIKNCFIIGYEKELNLQRMAFALQHAEICTQNTDKQEDFTELELGSDFVENENDMVTTLEYGGQIDLKQKELYLQQVKRWRENSTEERMYVSYWDFAGQVTYYSTHQAFMAPSAVYVLVIDLSLDLSEKLQENITFRTGILKHYTVEG